MWRKVIVVGIALFVGGPAWGAVPSAGAISWQQASPSPIPRGEALGAAVGGEVFVLGGYSPDYSSAAIRADAYSPDTDRWRRVADLPEPLTHVGTAVVDDRIYLAGGYIGEEHGTGKGGHIHQEWASKRVYQYDAGENAWAAAPALPKARGAGALAAVGRNLHFVGGQDAGRKDTRNHWVLNLDRPADGWKAAAALPEPRNHLGAIALGNYIYVLGGQRGFDKAAKVSSEVLRYDTNNDSWQRVASLPAARSHISSGTFVLHGKIVVAGGDNSDLKPTNTVFAYDPTKNSWGKLTALPGNRKSGVARYVAGWVVYATGYLDSTWRGRYSK